MNVRFYLTPTVTMDINDDQLSFVHSIDFDDYTSTPGEIFTHPDGSMTNFAIDPQEIVFHDYWEPAEPLQTIRSERMCTRSEAPPHQPPFRAGNTGCMSEVVRLQGEISKLRRVLEVQLELEGMAEVAEMSAQLISEFPPLRTTKQTRHKWSDTALARLRELRESGYVVESLLYMFHNKNLKFLIS
jgi:hypothetical protein